MEPVQRGDHILSIMNAIGATITEFSLLGLLVAAIFLGSNAALETFSGAPDLQTGFQRLSLGSALTIGTVLCVTLLFVFGRKFARYFLTIIGMFSLVLLMVVESTGDQWPSIALFGFLCYALPAIILLLFHKLP